MKLKTLSLVSTMCLLTACFGFKPFQPAPPEYKYWERSGTSVLEVKLALLECGYPSADGFYRNYIPNDLAAAQICMFKKGFNRDGYQGICSLSKWGTMPACQGRKCTDKSEFGCSPLPSFDKQ